jgi:uncharacterized repeat protein (TIGR01451 family)
MISRANGCFSTIQLLAPALLIFGASLARASNPVTITVGVVPAASVFGQPVVLTAAVTPSTATGKVTFYDETAVLGSAAVSNGVAVLPTSGIAYGQRHITARYLGDSNDSPGLSGAVVETVTTRAGGTFVAPTGPLSPIPGVTVLTPLAVADLNHDGYPDLVTSYSAGAPAGASIDVFINNGDGTFAAGVPYLDAGVASGAAIGDVDLDGNPDLIVSFSGEIVLLRGKGDGTFGMDSVIQLANERGAVRIADLNADGFPDLVVTRSAYGGPPITLQTVSVILGNGDGTFRSLPDFQTAAAMTDFVIGDFNRDGIPDLAIASYTGSSVSVLAGNGDGTFGTATEYETGDAVSLIAADVNDDGFTDLIAGNSYDLSVSVLLGSSNGTFRSAISTAPGAKGGLIGIFDVDGDGKVDVLSSTGISFGNGDGTFGPPVPTTFTGGIVADFNRDGIADVASVAPFPQTGISIYSGRLAPVLSISASPSPATAGQPVLLTITSSRADATGTITVLNLNTTQSTIGTVALANGSAIIQQPTAVLGSNSFWATYSGDEKYGSTQTPSIPVAVQQTGPTLTLTASPNPALVGQTITLTATLSNSIGNARLEFFDGATELNSQTLYSTQATFTTTLGAGTHQLRVEVPVYNGWVTAPVSFTEQINAASGGQLNPGPSLLSGGQGPGPLLAGDFNGDGVVDLAVANTTGQSISFFLGTNSGIFDGPVTIPLTFSPGGIALGQGTIDGLQSSLNLLATDPTDNSIAQIAYSTNTGTPLAAVIPVGTQPVAVASADFNNDGGADVITANAGSNDVSLMLTSYYASNLGRATSLAAGKHPDAIVVGDFNLDGQADFAVANRDDNNVMVFLGNGDGTFQMPVTTAAGNGPLAMVATDLNNDGKPDLAVVDGQSGQVTILIGSGDGTFRNSATYLAGPGANSIGAAIFGGSGFPGLAVTTSAGLLVFTGNGDGTFNSPTNFSQYAGAAGVAVGGFSGDSNMEIAVSLPATNSVAFVFNDSGVAATLSASPSTVVAGGKVTLTVKVTPRTAFGVVNCYDGVALVGSGIVTNGQAVISTRMFAAGTHSLSAQFIGAPGYASSMTPTTSLVVTPVTSLGMAASLHQTLQSTAVNLIPGDFNNDGIEDFAFENTPALTFETLLGNGDGTFNENATNVYGGNPAVAADFNNDGYTDITGISVYIGPNTYGPVETSFGTGGGHFVDFRQSVGFTYDVAVALAVADVNRDGWTDLIMANPNGSVDVVLGIGDGTFSPTHNFPLDAAPTAVAVADVNEDGKPDILVTTNPSTTAATLTVATGNGDGTFSTSSTGIAAAPVSIASADLNGDHHVDLVVAHSQGDLITILLGKGDGTFGPPAAFSLVNTPSRVLTADINGDGKADLVVMFTTAAPAYAVLYGNGDGTFQKPVSYNLTTMPSAIAVADVNNDGRPDVVVTSNGLNYQGSSLDVFLGTGVALSATEGAGQSAAVNASFAQAVTVQGPPNATVLFTFPSTGPSAYFIDASETSTTVTADGSGLATSPGIVSNSISGTYNLMASAPGLALSALIPLTNTAATPAAIAASLGNSQTQTINTAFPAVLQAAVTDAYGNPVPNVAVTFTAPGSGASATFAGSGTNVAVVNTNTSGIAVSPVITANSTAGAVNVLATVKGASKAANFTLNTVAATEVIIQLSSAGIPFTVDGTQYSGLQTRTFSWTPGDTHTISVGNVQSPNGQTQYAFVGWSDGGAATHTITVQQGVTTLVATFKLQYFLAISAGTGGTVSPTSGFFDPGPVTITATPNPGYVVGFDGPAQSRQSGNTLTINLTSAVSVDAYFTLYSPISLARNGPLSQGQLGATYTITVSNSPTAVATNGLITVTENLPPGLTLVSMSGGFFTCSGAVCTTGISLPPGDSFQITVTVNVAANAPPQIVNRVTVSGAGLMSANASDVATVIPSQTIMFGPIASVTFGAAPFIVSATASSGLAVSFSSTTPGVCTLSGATVTMLAGGVCSITATQAGNASFGAANVTQSFVVNAIAQTVTFSAPANPTVAPSVQVPLVATASSGLAVYFSTTSPGICTVSSPYVYFQKTGICTITAYQPGNATYIPATVTQTFTVGKTQTIAFEPIGTVPNGTTTITLNATTSSGNDVVLVSNTPGVCTVSGNIATIVGSGGCSITASAPGDTTYAAAANVTQSFIVPFNDIAPSAYYFNAVDLFAQYGITAGCGNDDFCADQNVTRAQMAVFIVTAMMNGQTFTYSPIPHFTDVQPTDFGFKWIQAMYELGISAGCSITNGFAQYCPNDPVTRDSMAVFIIGSRLGSGTNFTYPATPFFADVPSSDYAFKFVQRMRVDGITGGCTATTYCPSDPVTRGQMAIFIMAGLFNQLQPDSTPRITQISPAALGLGMSGAFTITGVNTNFAQGTTQLSPIPGVDIGTITVNSPTSLTVQLTAAGNATPRPYSIVAVTGSEDDVLPNGLVLHP